MSMTFSFLSLAVLLITANTESKALQDDWVPYKNEIYVKLFTQLDTYEGAMEFCSSQSDEGSRASLVLVKESDLQVLLTNYTQDVVDYIWLGAKYDNRSSQFKWQDGDALTYTNWHEGYPRNITDGDACIQLIPPDVKSSIKARGEWTHATCRKRNLVMCQKRIPWTLEEAVDKLIMVSKELENMEVKLAEVSSRVVPVGSIYIEYYEQPSPPTLWPNLEWEDITSVYAGLFFRALGGSSEEWGVNQPECAPRITEMNHAQQAEAVFTNPTVIPANAWSELGYAGLHYPNGPVVYEGLQFYTAGCEVRPQNQAIRIWKRIA